MRARTLAEALKLVLLNLELNLNMCINANDSTPHMHTSEASV